MKLENMTLLFTSNTRLAELGALAHRLQHRTEYNIQNDRQGAPKMADWFWKGA